MGFGTATARSDVSTGSGPEGLWPPLLSTTPGPNGSSTRDASGARQGGHEALRALPDHDLASVTVNERPVDGFRPDEADISEHRRERRGQAADTGVAVPKDDRAGGIGRRRISHPITRARVVAGELQPLVVEVYFPRRRGL